MSSFHQERVAAPTAPMQRIWSGYVSTPPVDANDTLKLVIPDMHPNLVVECKHWGGAIPDVDDSVLVIFDNNREPWVLSTWSTNSSGIGVAPSGPAGGDLSGSYPNPVVERSTASAFKFGSFGDVTLYRFAAKDLRTESDLSLLASDAGRMLLTANGGWPYITLRSPDPAVMTNVGSGIAFQLGVGGGASDWEFYTKPNSGGLLVWSQQQQLDMFRFSNDGFWFGPTFDTKLYRNGAGQLRTDGQMWAALFLSTVPNTGSWGFAQYLTGDSQPRLFTDYNGKLNWGPGSAAVDTNLYRNGAGSLRTDGGFSVGGALTTGSGLWSQRASTGLVALGAWVGSDAYDRFEILADGTLRWGTGAVAPDVSLYRWSANQLRTPGDLLVGGAFYTAGNIIARQGIAATQVQIGDNSNGYGYIGFGNPADINLYRWGAHFLMSDSSIWAGYNQAAGTTWLAVTATGDAQPRLGMLNNGYLNFGNGTATPDTNLYRVAANALKTDGSFSAGGPFFMTGSPGGQGAGVRYLGGAGGATSWYMNAATGGNLYFAVGETAVMTIGSSVVQLNQPLNFSGDTNLYRSGAGALKTDGSFSAGSITDSSFPDRIKGYQTLITSDANAAVSTGWYVMNGGSNLPAGSSAQFLVQMLNWNTTPGVFGVQLAFGLNDDSAWRRRVYSSSWSPWVAIGSGNTAFPGTGITIGGDVSLSRYGANQLAAGGAMLLGGNGWVLSSNDQTTRPQVRGASAIVTSDASGNARVNFVNPFPSTCLCVVCTNGDSNAGGYWYPVVLGQGDVNGFNFSVALSKQDGAMLGVNYTVRVNYIAYGY